MATRKLVKRTVTTEEFVDDLPDDGALGAVIDDDAPDPEPGDDADLDDGPERRKAPRPRK